MSASTRRSRPWSGIPRPMGSGPVHSPLQEPIVPAVGEPRWIARHLPPPGPADTAVRAFAAAGERDDDVGSNNWAVSCPVALVPAMLCSRATPHLDLTLPSIWYEAHIIVPGERDVYGVTIPGSPVTVIGFNRDLAWTLTNTGADVLDEYAETVDDFRRGRRRYKIDGQWRALVQRVENYRDPNGRVIATDTIRYSHRGPLTRRRALDLDADGQRSRTIGRALRIRIGRRLRELRRSLL